jgi:hypothetical protein
LSVFHKTLTFEQSRKAKFNPAPGRDAGAIRRNWMFDNEIDWVNELIRYLYGFGEATGETRRKAGLRTPVDVAGLYIGSVLKTYKAEQDPS